MTQRIVWIVDDDADVRDSLRLLLDACGFHAVCFSGAEEMLAADGRGRVGCFLFDMHMAGMNGMELLRQLRRDGLRAPAILITANGRTLEKDARDSGFFARLAKPVSESDLIRTIEAALAGEP